MRTTTSLMTMLLVAGCNAAPAEPIGQANTALQTTPSAAPVGGYQHSLGQSRFALGNSVIESDSAAGLQRFIGSQGIITIYPATGMVTGVAHSDSPIRAKARLPGTGDDHNNAVRNYFVSAGLPADQIGEVQAMARMMGTSEGYDNVDPHKNAVLQAFTSVIRRKVAGVRVYGSGAWAQLDADGEAVAEAVYWPPIPASVVADVKALQTIVADTSQLSALKGRLPEDLRDQECTVAIHHNTGLWPSKQVVFASYDCKRGGATLHFDLNGSRATLEEESFTGPTPPP